MHYLHWRRLRGSPFKRLGKYKHTRYLNGRRLYCRGWRRVPLWFGYRIKFYILLLLFYFYISLKFYILHILNISSIYYRIYISVMSMWTHMCMWFVYKHIYSVCTRMWNSMLSPCCMWRVSIIHDGILQSGIHGYSWRGLHIRYVLCVFRPHSDYLEREGVCACVRVCVCVCARAEALLHPPLQHDTSWCLLEISQ